MVQREFDATYSFQASTGGLGTHPLWIRRDYCICVCAAQLLSLPSPAKENKSYENLISKTADSYDALTDVMTENPECHMRGLCSLGCPHGASRKTVLKNINLSNIGKTEPLRSFDSLFSVILLSVIKNSNF